MPLVTRVSPLRARTASLTFPSNQSASGTPIARISHIRKRLLSKAHIVVHLSLVVREAYEPQSQSRRLNTTYRLPQTIIISEIAKG
jgi:hypothetical protein